MSETLLWETCSQACKETLTDSVRMVHVASLAQDPLTHWRVLLPAVKVWNGGNVTTTGDAGLPDRKVSLAPISLMLKKTICDLEKIMGIKTSINDFF